MPMHSLMRKIIPVAMAAGTFGVAVLAATSPAPAQDSGAMTMILGRITELENQMLNLTNRIEQLDYQVRELSSRVDLLSRDVDFRFSELGAPSTGAATTGGGASTAPTPPRLETPTLDSGIQGGSATGVTPPQISSGGSTAAATAGAGTPEAEFQSIRALLDARDYPAADAALRKFIGDYPNHPLASSAFFWLGEIYFERADYQRAAETYAAGFANYPNGYKAADTLLKLSLSLIELGRTSDGCTTLNQLRNAFPNAPINIQQRADQARASAGCS